MLVFRVLVKPGSHMSLMVGDLLSVIIQGEKFTTFFNHE